MKGTSKEQFLKQINETLDNTIITTKKLKEIVHDFLNNGVNHRKTLTREYKRKDSEKNILRGFRDLVGDVKITTDPTDTKILDIEFISDQPFKHLYYAASIGNSEAINMIDDAVNSFNTQLKHVPLLVAFEKAMVKGHFELAEELRRRNVNTKTIKEAYSYGAVYGVIISLLGESLENIEQVLMYLKENYNLKIDTELPELDILHNKPTSRITSLNEFVRNPTNDVSIKRIIPIIKKIFE